MNQHQLGLLLLAVGAGIAVLGLLVMGRALHWFGKLPGDIRIEREGFRLHAPVASMLLVSIALTVIGWLVRRLRP